MTTASVAPRQLRSPLIEAMRLDPRKAKRSRRKLVMTLALTSLVDAFSILLLYLLVAGANNGSSLQLEKAEKLPTAVKLEAIHPGTLVKLEKGKYFIDNEEISSRELAAKLQEIKTQKSGDEAETIIIQADRSADFQELGAVIRAGSISGFHKFKFAVLQGDETTYGGRL